jgi:putative oxidoreductase
MPDAETTYLWTMGRAVRLVALAALRIAASLMLLVGHGVPKLLDFAEKSGSFPDPLGVGHTTSLVLAIFAEVVCAALVALGLGTRIFVVPILVMLSVAAFVVHGTEPFAEKELALTYLAMFGAVFLLGPGELSIDHVIRRRWRQRNERDSLA